MKTQTMRTLQHAHWANLKILHALQLTNGRPENAMKWFSHVLAAEKVWLTRLNGKDSSPLEILPNCSLEDCERLIAENEEGFKVFVDNLTDDDFLRTITYRNSQGTLFNTAILDILTHVSLHGSYHRGQISTALRSEGYSPVNTDYIIFVRQNV